MVDSEGQPELLLLKELEVTTHPKRVRRSPWHIFLAQNEDNRWRSLYGPGQVAPANWNAVSEQKQNDSYSTGNDWEVKRLDCYIQATKTRLRMQLGLSKKNRWDVLWFWPRTLLPDGWYLYRCHSGVSHDTFQRVPSQEKLRLWDYPW